MTGKRYYFTTIGAWRRHAARCAETHFVAIRARAKGAGLDPAAAETTATDKCDATSFERTQAEACATEPTQGKTCAVEQTQVKACATEDATQILVLVDADEGAHLAMENDAEFDTLPHPLARVPVSQRVSAALAQFGVAHGDDTFTVAEKLTQVNPLLRHRVF